MDYVDWKMILNSICWNRAFCLATQSAISTRILSHTHKCMGKQTFYSNSKLNRKKFNQLEFYTIDTWHFPLTLAMEAAHARRNRWNHGKMLCKISCWSRAISFENISDIARLANTHFPRGEWSERAKNMSNKLCVLRHIYGRLQRKNES